MDQHSFTIWLGGEVAAARCALLELYERRDRMIYIDRPRLEREYMAQVGEQEEQVIREEIEVELLQKKQQMIQTALNRREPVDEAAIDAELEQLRRQKYQEAAGEEDVENVEELPLEKQNELQELYREIIRNYHPETHPEQTEAHRELYRRAQEAYRRQDLPALRLISELLNSMEDDGGGISFTVSVLIGEGSAGESQKKDYSTDYSLAGALYQQFVPTQEEGALMAERDRCRAQTDTLLEWIAALRSKFPFNAEEMLSDASAVENYRKELEARRCVAEQSQERYTRAIRAMMEEAGRHG